MNWTMFEILFIPVGLVLVAIGTFIYAVFTYKGVIPNPWSHVQCFKRLKADPRYSTDETGCNGLFGGIRETEYLQEMCITCPYLKRKCSYE